MDLGLAGKRALVTGSTKGIGRCIAETLLAEGASVAICARDAAGVEQAQFAIGFRRGQLDDAEPVNDGHRHPVMADTEILPRTLGLGAPVTVGGNVDRTETVGLAAHGGGSRGCCCSSHH